MTCPTSPCLPECLARCAADRPAACPRRGCSAECSACPLRTARPEPATAAVEASVLTRSLAEFNRVFGAYTSPTPTLDIPADVLALRLRLMREEFQELFDAIEVEKDLVNVAKEAADLAYVLQGTMAAFGLDLDAAIAEVHRSNMTKVGPDGLPVRDAGGKILKGPHYEKADIATALGLYAA